MDHEVTKDIILPLLLEYLPPETIRRINRLEMILELTNGSIAKFKSVDSGPLKFQSAERRWIWFDEEPTKAVWDECLMRAGAKVRLDLWMTMTPLQGMDWSYDEIYDNQKKGEIECFNAKLMDNTHIPKKTRLDLIEAFEGSDDAAARLEGAYFQRSGLIYKEFKEDLHVINPFPIPKDWPVVIALDPHPRKPSAAVWGAVSPEGVVYVVKELNERKEMLIKEFAERVKEESEQWHIVRRVIDPSALQGNQISGRTIKDELARCGLGAQLANNNTHYGWDQVRRRLRGVEKGISLFFFRTCSKTIWQMRHLVYEDWKFRRGEKDVKETQRKKDDDLADCVRYLCAANVTYEKEPLYDPDLLSRSSSRYTGY